MPTLLQCLDYLLQIIKEYSGFNMIGVRKEAREKRGVMVENDSPINEGSKCNGIPNVV